MEDLHPAGAEAGTERGAYLWRPPEGQCPISLSFDVIDRLGFEVMRGFGSVPKRGAEVGGLLLGHFDRSAGVLRIEDFLMAPCEHSRGPSFLLSETDLDSFNRLLARAREGATQVVGFFRSNTRDSLELTKEDLEILSRFPGEHDVVLMVKPFATRPPEATFFQKEGGSFASSGPGPVFVFRRRELGGGRAPRRGREEEPGAGGLASANEAATAAADRGAPATSQTLLEPALDSLTPVVPALETAPSPKPVKSRSSWVWIPLSFIFLLLGIVLGFQIALSFRPPQTAAQAADPYAIGLTVSEFNSNLHLRWKQDGAPVKAARKAVLHIVDGQVTKNVALTREDLDLGGVLYRNSTGNVVFRLEVFTSDTSTVSERVEIRMLDGEGAPAADR